jgi:hypothetical protein
MILPKTPWMLTIMLCIGASGAWGHDEHDALGNAPREKLGKVSFPVSCNTGAQKEFNRGMALFHSFWFDPAIKSFGRVLQYDPECGMAYWGIAIASMGNPFTWPPIPKAWTAGASAVADAQRVGAKTERERDYIGALAMLFKNWETTDYRPRVLAFQEAMEGVAARYPKILKHKSFMLSCSTLQRCPPIKLSLISSRQQISWNHYSRNIRIIQESLLSDPHL